MYLKSFFWVSASLACLEYLILGWRQTLENQSFRQTCWGTSDWCWEVALANATLCVGAVNRQNTNIAWLCTQRRWEESDWCPDSGIKNARHIIRSNVCGSGPLMFAFIIASFQYAAASLASSLLLLLQLNCVYSDYHLISSVAILKQNIHKHNL